jgi:hypothetical protein
MRRLALSAGCAVAFGGTALASDKPESFDRVLSYRANTMFNEELDGKAFLNGRAIVRVERVSPCVSSVWTRSGDAMSPLRRDLLEWDKMQDGDPHDDDHSYRLEFVYADHRDTDVVSMPKTAHPNHFEDTAGVSLMSCQPDRHHPD